MRHPQVGSILLQDVRHLARMMRWSPGFTSIAVLTLALGIGATTAIFSIVYGIVLKPLPFDESERLVGLWHRLPGFNIPQMEQSSSTYLTYRENARVFDDIGLWDTIEVPVTERGEPEQVRALQVSDGLLSVLRVQPLLGRAFTREDDAAGSPARTMLTYGYWQRRFGGSPRVLGEVLNVDGQPREVIGVLPASFKFLRTDPALLLPFQFDRSKVVVGNFTYQAVARLKPGVTLEQASTDVQRMIPLVFERFPMFPGNTRKMFDDAGLGPNVRPLSQDVIGDVGRMLWILLGTVGFVLLIACANVANLFLVRAEGRQQELALRAALGASRLRIARVLLTESLGLAIIGGALSVVFAAVALDVLVRLAPAGLPRVDEIAIDPAVLLFTVGISILAGLLFGAVPVIRFGTPSVAALKEGGRSSSDGPGRHRARSLMVVTEVALALVLLIVSGLMVRTSIALRQVDPGFVRPEQVQTFRVSIPQAIARDPLHVVRLYEQIAERLRQVPGVASVGLSSSVSMDGSVVNHPIYVEDFPAASKQPPLRRFKRLAPGYVETMGAPVLAGRTIDWTDVSEVRPVAVISENMAREYWTNPSEAVGKRLRQFHEKEWREIIGVVGNERDNGLDRPAPTVVYFPMLVKGIAPIPLSVHRNMAFVVRSARTSSPTLLRELQQAVWAINPNLPLASVLTLSEIRADSMARTSFALVMLMIAAGVALLLGIVGIYAVMAYVAKERTREIGIRMALGAQRGDVRRLFLRYGLVVTFSGILLGLGGALLLTRWISTLLFGVSPVDPVTYVLTSAGLTGVALLATYLPARRASRLDPLAALRSDT